MMYKKSNKYSASASQITTIQVVRIAQFLTFDQIYSDESNAERGKGDEKLLCISKGLFAIPLSMEIDDYPPSGDNIAISQKTARSSRRSPQLCLLTRACKLHSYPTLNYPK